MTAIKGLTFVMFSMFAMTTDSVGIIIPQIVKAFRLSLTAAGAFQYATMSGIAMAGFFLGHMADRLGRKSTIVAGLTLFALTSYLFIAGTSFPYFCALMALSGIAIGVF
jgi:fucose permease